jgi:hypothetical protein
MSSGARVPTQSHPSDLGHQAVGRHGGYAGRDPQELSRQLFEIIGLGLCIQDLYREIGL